MSQHAGGSRKWAAVHDESCTSSRTHRDPTQSSGRDASREVAVQTPAVVAPRRSPRAGAGLTSVYPATEPST